MSTIIVALSLLALTLSAGSVETSAPKYDTIIVVKVDNLSGDVYRNISLDLAKDANANIEYACMWSGVMVIKLINSTISSKGDAQMYIRSRLGSGQGIDFLHVYMEQSLGSTKC